MKMFHKYCARFAMMGIINDFMKYLFEMDYFVDSGFNITKNALNLTQPECYAPSAETKEKPESYR